MKFTNCSLYGSAFWLIFLLVMGCGRTDKGGTTDQPEENRFTKVVLADGWDNPVQLDIAADGRIYVIEMRGNLYILDEHTKEKKVAGFVPTYDGGEYGLIGMRLDPDFAVNRFIYLSYFVKDSVKINYISRFTMRNDSLDLSSEKNYLKIPYESICCHTAGGMAFDPEGNLYVSTGDDTQAGFTYYSPSYDGEGCKECDALRSAGNTNDYRGKILRIHPEPDGNYSIPKGNLFSEATDSTKPEIYIMGVRNPFRITVNQQSGHLYWGEVGPDADVDSTFGPKGYDEFNRASHAGNFGWPLFIGDNKAYSRVYYTENNRVGNKFDQEKPENFSHRNTGIRYLPPAQPALIWYPYDTSEEFPSFGVGGRSAVGGPFYHYDATVKSETKFPAYYDGCWFIADWMRNWIKVVHFDKKANIERIEDFMPTSLFKKPVFMQFGKNGSLYVIEHGSNWVDNPDNSIVRIDYNAGNRPPVARINADKSYGQVPLDVTLSAVGSVDPDKDELTYTWKDATGKVVGTGVETKINFTEAGEHRVELVVNDKEGLRDSSSVTLHAGNAMPLIAIEVPNQTFYRDVIDYSVNVTDEEDGTIGNGIKEDDVQLTVQHVPFRSSFSVDSNSTHNMGLLLINESDCRGCHQIDGVSAGPSFLKIAERYGQDRGHVPVLAEKVIKGGSGVWGEVNMSPHPQLSRDQATKMVDYILGLAVKPSAPQRIPLKGKIEAKKEENRTSEGQYFLEATYTDRGGEGIGPLVAKTSLLLRSSVVPATQFDMFYDSRINGEHMYGRHASYGRIKQIDLSGIKEIEMQALVDGGKDQCIEVRLDAPDGTLVGRANFTKMKEWDFISAQLAPTTGKHDVYFVFTNKADRFTNMILHWVQFVAGKAGE